MTTQLPGGIIPTMKTWTKITITLVALTSIVGIVLAALAMGGNTSPQKSPQGISVHVGTLHPTTTHRTVTTLAPVTTTTVAPAKVAPNRALAQPTTVAPKPVTPATVAPQAAPVAPPTTTPTTSSTMAEPPGPTDYTAPHLSISSTYQVAGVGTLTAPDGSTCTAGPAVGCFLLTVVISGQPNPAAGSLTFGVYDNHRTPIGSIVTRDPGQMFCLVRWYANGTQNQATSPDCSGTAGANEVITGFQYGAQYLDVGNGGSTAVTTGIIAA